MKRKLATFLILSLLLMALPLGSAMAAGTDCTQKTVINGTQSASYSDLAAQLQQLCGSGTSCNTVYARCLKALQGQNIQSMSLNELRALVRQMSGSAGSTAAPTAKPTAAATVQPTAAPTAQPTATSTAQPTAAPTVQPTAAPTVQPTAAPTTNPSTGSMSALEQQMINLVNEDRAANGLPALTYDAGLRAGALKHSQDMSAGNYFSHTSPTYGSFSARVKASGVSYRTAGENIALYNSVEKAEAALMNSEGHRANILSTSFTRIGIGIVWNEAKGAYYITQWFAG